MKGSTKVLLVIWIPILTAIVIFMGYCTIGMIQDSNNPDAWKKSSHNHDAYTMAQRFVKENLKYPETAEFSPYDSSNIQYTESKHIYKITGSLQSKNALGLLVPMHYSVVIQQINANDWKLLKISLE